MGWLSSMGIGLLMAIPAAVGSGFVANLGVGWYSITSREGASGYFVIAMALLGAIGGVILGTIVARLMPSAGNAPFLKALGAAALAIFAVLLVIGSVSRLLAHVPPRIDGESLFLDVEFRFPPGMTNPPAADTVASTIELRALIGGSLLREDNKAPLWKDRSRQEDGRWILPGAVPVTTERGRRVLTIQITPKESVSFGVPLPRRPGRKYLEWSDWLPRQRPGGEPPATPYSYRFRVVKASEPLRRENFGPFEILKINQRFTTTTENGVEIPECSDHFRILHRGKPVSLAGAGAESGDETSAEVMQLALIPGEHPALLAGLGNPYVVGSFFLVTESNGAPSIRRVNAGEHGSKVAEIGTGAAGRDRSLVRELNLVRANGKALLEVGSRSVVDPIDLAIHHFEASSEYEPYGYLPTLGVSPDRRSLVRMGYEKQNGTERYLVVTDFVAGSTYGLKVDRSRMRYAALESLEGSFVEHHFEWIQGPTGHLQLRERAAFMPLPHRGRLKLDADGYREYRVEGGLAGLREVFEGILQREFGGVRETRSGGTEYAHEFLVNGQTVHVTLQNDSHERYVGLYMDRGKDSRIVEALARRFDEELATGRHDALIQL